MEEIDFEDGNISSEVVRNGNKFVLFEIFIGIFGIICSIFSVFVATFIGVTTLSLQNGSLLLLLSILILVFLTIRTIYYFFENRKKIALLCFILVLINIFVFLLKLIEFISIPFLIFA
ncbi:MAG: hypothetical protein PHP82_01020 [Candidatus ainarchaeum sp.]|nr:hypothetical protein [Candidatus ainarchaeum sp.]